MDDLRGQVAIVTGANTGIGYHTASALAQRGCHVFLACRDVGRGETAAVQMSTSLVGGHGEVEFVQCDLSSSRSIQGFVKAFEARQLPLHILINSAGVNTFGEPRPTTDNLEAHFGVNYFGHFALTNLLLPVLRRSAEVRGEPFRVVNLSSVMHWFATTDYRGLAYQLRDDSYSSSKLFMSLFTLELQKREALCEAVSVNPGAVQSDIYRDMQSSVSRCVIDCCWLSTKSGAETSIYAATAPTAVLKKLRGAAPLLYLTPYWVPSWLPECLRWLFEVGGPCYFGPSFTLPSAVSRDEGLAGALWAFSAQLMAQTGYG